MPTTTGTTIRRIRLSNGMTQAELGALIHFTQPGVSQLEHDGPAVHDLRVLRRVAKALQVPLSMLVAEDEEVEATHRTFVTAGPGGAGAGAATGHRPTTPVAPGGRVAVGITDVERITKGINQIHKTQLMVGGDQLCELAVNEARYVEHLLDHGTYTDKVGKALTSASAEMMTAAGWIHYDAGRSSDANRYYADAAKAATAAGDGIAAAHAWINACLLSYREGARPKEGVKLAEAAQLAARREGGPKLRALAAIREAEAYSVIGDRSAMAAAVRRAHRAFDSTRGLDPGYLEFLSAAQLSGLTGLAFMRIGDYAEAANYLKSAIKGTSAYPRERTAWQIRLAQNYVRAGDVADGCAVLIDNLDEISTVESERLQTAIAEFVSEVRSHPAVPEVCEFLERWTAL
ncbi:helix-turn-helix domain-containing protein [Nocardia sp. CDC160]|uniref:helix-turn-helix domain-containing protein n=1 Tax=Nocardia sp. CDC160 TaxID=3112166 RepID=UPI002DB66DAD|nr:helix-turn-helix domain-containing protein [Nocardia sp. CDC160]MEC3917702.1 helix-turn-helix domain-containing protein [Nocardia sp. CDC160]